MLDAPLQMQREVRPLRAAAGKPDDSDLEPMLQAAAAVWPAELAPVESIRFEPGRLTLGASAGMPRRSSSSAPSCARRACRSRQRMAASC